jgi:hypothetical protein
VVALKPPAGPPRLLPPSAKQERRGGIETAVATMESTTDAHTKQERRGGIETHIPYLSMPSCQTRSRNAVVALKPSESPNCPGREGTEAGTPWWH